MRIRTIVTAAAALALMPAAAMAQVAYNSTPDATWYFGNSTDYSPANSVVLTAGSDQLFLRWHERYPVALAPASAGSVYSFGQNINAPSFDFGFTSGGGLDLQGLDASLTITNIGTGASYTFDPLSDLGDNVISGNSLENSENLSFPFLSGVGFVQGVNDTYRVSLTVQGLASGTQTLSADARVGDGAVPEPASWALMLGGFGLVGGAMRRRKTAVRFA
jgi:hypothetical protein